MAGKKDLGPPKVVFIGPPQSRIKHNLVVFEVQAWRGDGTPLMLRLMSDEETVKLKGGECFMTGYVQEHALKPWTSRS